MGPPAAFATRRPSVADSAGPDPAACLGACAATVAQCSFLEPRVAVRATEWKFVGPGNGRFDREQKYRFVGEGVGSFDKQEEPAPGGHWRLWAGCWAALGLLAAALLTLALLPSPAAAASSTTLAPAPAPAPAAPPATTPGPPPPPVLPPPAPMLHDCNYQGVNEWGEDKKAWCCEKFHNGCPSAMPYDCTYQGVDQWSPDKSQWCCLHFRNGCPTLFPPPTAPPFNCVAGFATWVQTWTLAQKSYCCEHFGRGCPETGGCVTAAPSSSDSDAAAAFDCSAGYANWHAAWSAPQKAWCCLHAGKGCAAAPCPMSR